MNTLKMPTRVLFYCQYLVGIGHVRRSALIVQALQQAGFEVHVIFGGLPVNISFGKAQMHYLKPVKSIDAGFSALVHANGSPFTADDKRQRCADLLRIATQINPSVVITETFPFGRRMMRFELEPLLEWTKQQNPRPRVISSIRDILQRRRPEREQETLERIQQYYDHIWVHGDEQLTPLDASFPPAGAIRSQLYYTGYVCPPAVERAQKPTGIVVSVGGGHIGHDLLMAAFKLYQSGFKADQHWTFLTGPHMDEAHYQQLAQEAGKHMTLMRMADDFVERLAAAAMSVSLGGYNTTMDILQTQVPAVLAPFEKDGQTEQLQRTQLLAEKGRVVCLRHEAVTPLHLQKAIEDALTQQQRLPVIAINGAETAAQQLLQWCSAH